MSDLALLLIGAGIALASSIVTAMVQHLLGIRAEQKKLELAERQAQRDRLTGGGDPLGAVRAFRDAIESRSGQTYEVSCLRRGEMIVRSQDGATWYLLLPEEGSRPALPEAEKEKQLEEGQDEPSSSS